MFDIASTTALITTTSANIGIAVAAVLGVVLGAWAALIGLGYFTRKVQKKVTGGKV